MNQNDRYFFYSGVISLTFFTSIILGLLYSVTFAPKPQQYAMHLSDIVSVSIDLSPRPVNKDKKQESVATNEQKEQTKPEVEKTIDEPVIKPADIKPNVADLFSNVKESTNPIKESKNSQDSKNLEKIERELLTNVASNSFAEKSSKIDVAKPSIEIIDEGGSTGPAVNEYHAKVQAVVYNYFKPPAGTIGAQARIKIKLSASGDLLNYSIIKSSKLGSFNSELEWLRDRLKGVKFPRHPESREANLVFILTAKE